MPVLHLMCGLPCTGKTTLALQLEAEHGCQLQVGGSDQLGNMISGIDLIRRVHQRPAWALAWPLLTAADGALLAVRAMLRL